jgi:hypothetical protein
MKTAYKAWALQDKTTGELEHCTNIDVVRIYEKRRVAVWWRSRSQRVVRVQVTVEVVK